MRTLTFMAIVAAGILLAVDTSTAQDKALDKGKPLPEPPGGVAQVPVLPNICEGWQPPNCPDHCEPDPQNSKACRPKASYFAIQPPKDKRLPDG